jgi:hypothetical protein
MAEYIYLSKFGINIALGLNNTGFAEVCVALI